MKEIVRLGDNPVKISTKQKSIIKSFFKKVKRGVIAHFKDGISFKDIIVMEKEYGAFEKKITDIEKVLYVKSDVDFDNINYLYVVG